MRLDERAYAWLPRTSRDHVVRRGAAVSFQGRSLEVKIPGEMAAPSGSNEATVGQPHLAKQDLSTLVSAHDGCGAVEEVGGAGPRVYSCIILLWGSSRML